MYYRPLKHFGPFHVSVSRKCIQVHNLVFDEVVVEQQLKPFSYLFQKKPSANPVAHCFEWRLNIEIKHYCGKVR